MSYTLEVIEAGSHEVTYEVDGIGTYQRTYLICIAREVHSGAGIVRYVGTLFNETENKPVLWNGQRRYVSGNRDAAESWFWQCMGLKREVA